MEKMNSQARIFAITEILYENHLEGIANKELAKSVGTTQSNICRDMALFEQFGWAERNAHGKWRLSPKFGGIAGQIMKSYKVARLELSKEEEKYATAMQ
ncbi:MAG: hypothetical protein IKO57_06675 [Treponema sp.]|jgi:DNA-binding IclR family transcriptional regulator|nr:hypothetical protein [Treponema sp.]MBR4630111.1 hypothetical protein [Treponema sp.]